MRSASKQPLHCLENIRLGVQEVHPRPIQPEPPREPHESFLQNNIEDGALTQAPLPTLDLVTSLYLDLVLLLRVWFARWWASSEAVKYGPTSF